MAKPKSTRKPTRTAGENTISLSDARIRLTELVNRAAYGAERFVIVRRGKPVAELIGARDLGELDGAA